MESKFIVRGNPRTILFREVSGVTPFVTPHGDAGSRKLWIPASAGMTENFSVMI